MYEAMLYILPENSTSRAIQDYFVTFWATQKLQKPYFAHNYQI